MSRISLIHGHAPEALRSLPADSVQCVVTSPPYWGLRAYGTEPQVWGGEEHEHAWTLPSAAREQAGGGSNLGNTGSFTGSFCACGAWRGELGLEPTPELYVSHLVEVFREVRRVLRPDGVLWLNIGDSYANDGKWGGSTGGKHAAGLRGKGGVGRARRSTSLKPKDLVGIPWRVAFALQADGWWLRSEVIWHKPNPMPESVRDRPTRAHEQVFLLSKSAIYYYDAEAIKEPASDTGRWNGRNGRNEEPGARPPGSSPRTLKRIDYSATGRNSRSVWTIAPQPCPVAHFATFPQELAARCIQAGTSEHGACAACGAPWARVMERKTTGWAPTCAHSGAAAPCVVLDCFSGTGTTGKAAAKLGRDYIGIDLHGDHTRTAKRRLTFSVDGPLFHTKALDAPRQAVLP